MGKKKLGKNKANAGTDKSATQTNDNSGKKKNNNKAQGGKKNKRNAAQQPYYDTQLQQLIEADGSKSVIEMASDGNCLFRSISDQLYHDYGYNHEEVRGEICDFLEAHKDEFSHFLVLDDEDARDDEDAADFEQYVQSMRQSSEWGGNIELVVAARLYRRNIIVYSASLAAFTIDHGQPNKGPAGPDLLLSYHDSDHYNSVRDNTAKGKPPPPVKTFVKNGAAELRQLQRQLAAGASFLELPNNENLGDDDKNNNNNNNNNNQYDEKSKHDIESSEAVSTSPETTPHETVKNEANEKKTKKNVARAKRDALAKDKHLRRLDKIHAEKVPNSASPLKEDEMAGQFRILKI